MLTAGSLAKQCVRDLLDICPVRESSLARVVPCWWLTRQEPAHLTLVRQLDALPHHLNNFQGNRGTKGCITGESECLICYTAKMALTIIISRCSNRSKQLSCSDILLWYGQNCNLKRVLERWSAKERYVLVSLLSLLCMRMYMDYPHKRAFFAHIFVP